MRTSKIILGLLVGLVVCSSAARPTFCQTEKLDIVTYTPPKGWAKTFKEGAVVYTDMNKSTNAFCVLTVYAGTMSAGSPQKDFVNEWTELVIKPFKADANPKTEIQTNPDGWSATAGGAQIELDGGIKAAAVLTVFSGFGKTTSILAIFNDESYLAQVSTLIDGIKLDKTKALAHTVPPVQNNSSPTSQRDPFPDKPGFQPQQPLAGPLKESITMADLAGIWDNGGAAVTTYVNSSSGNYSGTDTTFFTENYSIKPDGSFTHSFQGRTSNHTVRETSTGTFSISDGCIWVTVTGGEGKGSRTRYQFVSFMTLPNGGAVLTMIHIGDTDPLRNAEQLYWACSHGKGYITCIPGDTWTRRLTR